jgi:sortase (surface protein transpeptidase)
MAQTISDRSPVATKRASPQRKRAAESRALAVLEHTGWVPFACAIAAMMMIAVAGITWITSPYWGDNNAQAKARNVGAIPTAPAAAQPSAVANIVSPNRIEIPKINAEAPIVPVGTTPDGELDVPLNPKTVGWWQYGAKPGATKGTAILAGHINYKGVTGAMAAIGKLNPGDAVYVFGKQNADAQHEVRFRVTGVRTYHKSHLPYKQLFDQNSVGRIVIVTCGGPFDASTGNYLDNIVVFAVPEPSTTATGTPGIPGLTTVPTGIPGLSNQPSPSDTAPSDTSGPRQTPSPTDSSS